MKIGTKVIMVGCSEAKKYEGKVWTTRSEPWKCCGSEVVLLEGKSGGFDTSHLKIVQEPGECPTECKYCPCSDATGKCTETNWQDGAAPCDNMEFREFEKVEE